jgi:hypothetical protein
MVERGWQLKKLKIFFIFFTASLFFHSIRFSISLSSVVHIIGIMIEDQVAPKRCGHVSSKSMIPFDEAIQLVKAACDDDARAEYERLYGLGSGPLVLARTDMPYRRLLGLPRLYEGGRVGRANAGIL